MPKITLVVCLHKERDLLERLLKHSEGCYDELVVVHDGPENAECEHVPAGAGREACCKQPEGRDELERARQMPNPESGIKASVCYTSNWKSPEELSLREPNAPPIELAIDYSNLPPDSPIPTGYRLATGHPVPGSVHELVQQYGGRFFEGPRCFQQEPHWPFAWWVASHDWILRLDADEFPTLELKEWLMDFKQNYKIPYAQCEFLAVWPLWNGVMASTKYWPTGRLFLMDRQQNTFFGMVEQTPTPLGEVQSCDKTLAHQPSRKSYGFRNIVLRRQAYIWRSVIAGSLIKSPLLLPRWKCQHSLWPAPWSGKIQSPLAQAIWSLFCLPLFQAREMIRKEGRIDISACLNPGLHHFLLGLAIFKAKHFK